MSSSAWDAPCRQNAKLRESGDKSTAGPVPYQETSSRQNLLRHREGCDFRKVIMLLKKRNMSCFVCSRLQSSQLISLSWLYGLLFPKCVFRNSSPARNIGTPLERRSRQQKFLVCFRRRSKTAAGAPSSPSWPQFQL